MIWVTYGLRSLHFAEFADRSPSKENIYDNLRLDMIKMVFRFFKDTEKEAPSLELDKWVKFGHGGWCPYNLENENRTYFRRAGSDVLTWCMSRLYVFSLGPYLKSARVCSQPTISPPNTTRGRSLNTALFSSNSS